ncbi:MAG: RIP metalloprotease RseP [Alphaproteobacteria bacterium]|nr:RIP metalloprotease RseP [Alphaproteobacteria bacterium]
MDFLLSLLAFIVVLGPVVFVHEFGHFIVARLCGVKVETFSIGFGPEIRGWNDRYGTRWKIAWLPLGGYVKMFGDSDPASSGVDEKAADFTEDEKKVAFYTQKVSRRFAIVGAGPVGNYLFAIIVLTALFLIAGQPYTPPVVDTVMEKSVALEAGLKPGDRIVSIDGKPMNSFEDIKREIALNMGTPANVVFERDGVAKDLLMTPEVVRTTDRLGGEHVTGRIGITSSQQDYRKLTPLKALQEAVNESWTLSVSTLKGVGQMIIGVRGTDELGGPIRIAEMSGKVAKDGLGAFVWFLAVISINLGLINLFPIPLLDGGHLVFYLAEGMRGRPLSERVQEYGARAGLFLVVSLMLFATWNDLVHLRVISFLRGLFS